jgi:hypothetical protein
MRGSCMKGRQAAMEGWGAALPCRHGPQQAHTCLDGGRISLQTDDLADQCVCAHANELVHGAA